MDSDSISGAHGGRRLLLKNAMPGPAIASHLFSFTLFPIELFAAGGMTNSLLLLLKKDAPVHDKFQSPKWTWNSSMIAPPPPPTHSPAWSHLSALRKWGCAPSSKKYTPLPFFQVHLSHLKCKNNAKVNMFFYQKKIGPS